MRGPRHVILTALFTGGVFLLAGCSEEEATPVDLGGDVQVFDDGAVVDPDPTDADPDDPNAAAREQVIGLAEQQCMDDPDLEEGVVQIVDPATDEVVNEFVADCNEVRSRTILPGDEDDPTASTD